MTPGTKQSNLKYESPRTKAEKKQERSNNI